MAAAKATLAAIFAEHAAFVLRSVRRLGARPGDVEDLAQEVFTVVHRKLDEYEGTGARSWLFAIARRVVSDYRRRAHVRREVSMSQVPEPAAEADLTDRSEQAEMARILDQGLDLLDEEKRAVFLLFDLEELPMNEVAALVGCPIKTAYSRLYAARDIIRTFAKQALGPSAEKAQDA